MSLYQRYLIASQTGLRAQELNSLKPTSFNLNCEPATVTIACTVSKRRKTNCILLSRDFVRMLNPWLDDQDPDRRLWGCSASWYYKAADMLRLDLEAAGIEHTRLAAVVDFHAFGCFRITRDSHRRS